MNKITEYRIREAKLRLRKEQEHARVIEAFINHISNPKCSIDSQVRWARVYYRQTKKIEDKYTTCLRQLRNRNDYANQWSIYWENYSVSPHEL